MTIQFRTARVKFDPTKGITQKEPANFNFSGHPKGSRVGFAINGFRMKYTYSDREIWEQSINVEETNRTVNGNNVSVPVTFLLRDKSGNIDDTYEGWVDVLAIAEI